MAIFDSLQQGVLLKAYTPSPHDGKFASDLYLALQNHTPLTLLQKIFIFFTVAIPGSANWKLSLFEYIYSISFAHFLTALAVLFLIYIAIHLLRKFSWRFISKRQPLVFLELTFFSMTSKS